MEAFKKKTHMHHRPSSRRVFVLIGMLIFSLLLSRVIGFSIVEGTSCAPTLHDGELILVVRHLMPLGKGDLVTFSDTDNYRVVKRIAEIRGNKMWVLGDNSEGSIDSRYYGYVDLSRVDGRVFRLPFYTQFATGFNRAHAEVRAR